jgi:adenine deaminase
MMNFPGVLAGDDQVMAKLRVAQERGKPIDGHAPGLRGEMARRYIDAGITTDHECVALEEAEEKIACGAKVAIREGSAARNFAELRPLLSTHAHMCFLCSDDKHPDELATGHIDALVRRAIAEGVAPLDVLQAACVNPVLHYGLDVGLLRVGDPADFIVVDSLDGLRVLKTYIAGRLVAEDGAPQFELPSPTTANRFLAEPRTAGDFRVEAVSGRLHAIRALDGQLITECEIVAPKLAGNLAVSDPQRDLLKIAVVNRYVAREPAAVAFIHGMGLQRGAIASSVAHDCHNVVAVGVDDDDLCAAVNLVIDSRGGLAVACGSEQRVLPLPVAGLMATGSCAEVAAAYAALDRLARDLGSRLRAPFMTLSFMALLVIPAIKLSDRGLFDGNRFQFMPLFV